MGVNVVKLGDVATISAGQSAPKSNYFCEEGIPFVRAGSLEFLERGESIDLCEKISEDNAQICKLKLYPKNSILFAKSGMSANKGRIYKLERSAYIVSHLAIITPEETKLIPEYLMYCLQKHPPKTLIKDESYPSIALTDIANMKMELPPLEEQKKIAKILDKADKIRAKKKLANDKLDEFLKSTFISMFGDPVKNSKFFKVDKLEKYIKVLGGYAFKSNLFKESGIPVLRIGNINTGKLKMDNVVYWDDDASLSKYKLYPKDLVISLTGTVGKDDYGNVCILPSTCPCYYLNQRNAKLVVNREVINIYYLCHLLKNKEVKSKLTNISRGVRQANISNSDILNLEVVIPPIEDQNKFAQIVEHVEAQKQKNELVIEQMNNLFNSLSQRAFKGEL